MHQPPPEIGTQAMITSREVVIEARGLVRRFGPLVAVDGLDLDVHRGEVFGFLGPNGAGKSTAIRMLVGLLEPTAGTARVLGYEMPREVEDLRPHVGYMTQKFSLWDDLTVEENLEFAAEIFGMPSDERRRRVDFALEDYGLLERRRQRPATLSGGWRQRLALAAATLHGPELLFLDEPTAGVDPDSRRLFWGKLFEIASTGTTILVSTHYMDEALRCHRLCLIRQGRRAALGGPRRLMSALDGRVLELEVGAQDAERAIDLISQRVDVASVTQLGRRLHVLLAQASQLGPEHVAAGLDGAGIRSKDARWADPDLEDVFVAVAQGERLREGGRDLI